MKVVHINTTYKYAAPGKIAKSIHDFLQHKGHVSYILYGRKDSYEDNNVKRIASKLSVYFHFVITRLFGKHGFGSTYKTKKIIKILSKISPDVVHLHNLHGYYINIRILFNYLARKKYLVVWTLHDCWPFTGHCTHFEYIDCNKWKNICYDCPQHLFYPKSFVDRSQQNFLEKQRLFNMVDNMVIVTPSYWLQPLVKQSFLHNYSSRVIPNGVNTNVFRQLSIEKQNYYIKNLFKNSVYTDKFKILGVASGWGWRKGFYHFLKLSNLLKKDEIIILVGVNEEQKSLLPHNIVGIERTENVEELVSLYNLADVFVNLTMEDNYPTTNLESTCSGTPVVSYDTGGSPESISETTGYVVEKENIEQVRSAIDIIKSQGKETFSSHCLTKCKNHFDQQLTVNRYYDLYNELYLHYLNNNT